MPRPALIWKTIMRFTPVSLAAAVLLATVSSTSLSAPARPTPISEVSRAMEAEARRLQDAGDLEGAIGFYETALAADPRNAAAFVGLGEIARAQDLPGKAIGFFREALALAPDDRGAIAGQGEAMVQRGALDKARQNLARLSALCGEQACDEVQRLTASINAAGARTAMRTDDTVPQTVGETVPEASN